MFKELLQHSHFRGDEIHQVAEATEKHCWEQSAGSEEVYQAKSRACIDLMRNGAYWRLAISDEERVKHAKDVEEAVVQTGREPIENCFGLSVRFEQKCWYESKSKEQYVDKIKRAIAECRKDRNPARAPAPAPAPVPAAEPVVVMRELDELSQMPLDDLKTLTSTARDKMLRANTTFSIAKGMAEQAHKQFQAAGKQWSALSADEKRRKKELVDAAKELRRLNDALKQKAASEAVEDDPIVLDGEVVVIQESDAPIPA